MKQLVCLLTLAATFWLVLPSDGIEVRSLYSNVILDEKNLHRNIISLNLLPKRLPIDKLTLLETQLKLQLSTKLWSPRAEVIGTEDLALYIQALHASCFNPFDFYGVNLVQMLTNYTSQPEKYKVTSFEDHLTTLTLCLLSKNASHFTSLLGSAEKLDRLLGRHNGPIDSLQYLRPFPARNASNLLPDPMSTNDLLMKSLAVSCYARHVPHDRNIRFELNDLMASVFMTQNITDGSFNGSITTTSLAVQAFIESGLDRLSFLWDRRKAVNFIMNSVHGRDVNATLAYFMVPAFHRTWHEIQCWNKSNSFNHVDTEDEYVRTWTRALNQVLNQADSSVNVTVSRWVYRAGRITPVPF